MMLECLAEAIMSFTFIIYGPHDFIYLFHIEYTSRLAQRILRMKIHRFRSISRLQNIYAKAIYDNIAESPDELAFKRGDLLTVIEQDTDGLEGWWLCSLRGRQVRKCRNGDY